MVRFAILGPLEVRRDDRPVVLPGPRVRAILAALIVCANEPVSPERLAVALWGDDAPARAVQTVQVHVSRLRKALGGDDDLVETTAAGYRLRVGRGELDAERFAALLEQARAADPARALELIAEALALWRGEALADVAYAPFAQAEIARLTELRLAAVEARADAAIALGRHDEVIAELAALAGRHPAREALTRRLMVALYRGGRQAEALAAYRRTAAHLADELGLEPSPALRDLEHAVLTHAPAVAGDRASAGATRAAPQPLAAPAGRLPAWATPLVGRRAECAAVLERLQRADVRLLTLVGPGGVGKTRLAREVAARSAGTVAWVELAGVAREADVSSALVAALGASALGGETPEDALLRFLGPKSLLLVADNVEHVIGAAAPLLARIAAEAPAVTVLATSREPLDVTAEHQYPVLPLPPPDAAALFAGIATRRDPGFVVTPVVEEICRRLDGLPLAIELAAARTPSLPLDDLAMRLDDALSALGRGPRDAPARHRTLRATLDWSHDRLDPAEREAFTSFAVFAGGATFEAVQEVNETPLDVIDALVAKHLLVRRGTRLVMLEVLRQYSAERFAASTFADRTRERHCRWLLALAEAAAPQLLGPDRASWSSRLDAEADNLAAALDWATSGGSARLGLRLAAALGEWWAARNADAPGVRRLDAALATAGAAAAPAERAAALLARAALGDWGYGDTARVLAAEADAEAALALYREAGDRRGIARSLNLLSGIAGHRGEWRRSVELAEGAAAEARAAGADLETGVALARKATAARTVAELRRDLDPALALFRAIGSTARLGSTLSVAGFLAISAEAYDDARDFLEEALATFDPGERSLPVAKIHGNLGLAALFGGRHVAAAAAFHAQLAICGEAVVRTPAAEGLAGTAALASVHDRLPEAATLFGAAGVLGFRAVGAEARVYRRLIERFIDPARERLGSERWETAAAAGARLQLLDAIAIARTAAPPSR